MLSPQVHSPNNVCLYTDVDKHLKQLCYKNFYV